MKDYKYEQVYYNVIDDINHGYLRYQDKLPSVRKMAEQLNVSRTTVENAYYQLMIEGYIYAKEKVGYFVDIQDVVKKQNVDVTTKRIEKKKYRYDFSGSQVDQESFNIEIWKKYIKRALNETDELLSYGSQSGEERLKRQLQVYSKEKRGLKRPLECYVVGAGFQNLLYYVCSLFQGNVSVAMEDNGFKQAEAVFRDCHIRVVKIHNDDLGMRIDELKKHQVQLVYINSSSGGYHGQSIKQQRRNELIKYAHDYNAYIIEDDHNGELKFNSKPIDAMAKLDDERIFYLGSFSKLLLPSIRMSYLVLPVLFTERFEHIISDYHPMASKLEQLALAMYIEDGQLTRHLKRLRKHYYRKGNYMLQLLQKTFPQYHFELYETALKITMSLSSDRVDSYIELAKQNDILVRKNSHHQIAFSLSGIVEEDIEPALQLLKIIWK